MATLYYFVALQYVPDTYDCAVLVVNSLALALSSAGNTTASAAATIERVKVWLEEVLMRFLWLIIRFSFSCSLFVCALI